LRPLNTGPPHPVEQVRCTIDGRTDRCIHDWQTDGDVPRTHSRNNSAPSADQVGRPGRSAPPSCPVKGRRHRQGIHGPETRTPAGPIERPISHNGYGT
jgi:hypothetical protein